VFGYLLLGDRLPRFGDDDRLWRLSPFWMAPLDDHNIGHFGMAEYGPFDLGGIDVLPTTDDHVVSSPEDVEEAFLVRLAQIAGKYPIVAEALGLSIGSVSTSR